MSITGTVKALLALRGKKQADLMRPLDMGSKQSLSNKFSNGRWSAADLAKVADVCGCKLAFVLPDGEHIFIDSETKEDPDA